MSFEGGCANITRLAHVLSGSIPPHSEGFRRSSPGFVISVGKAAIIEIVHAMRAEDSLMFIVPDDLGELDA